ncbi:3-oxoacyl-[acyl-carrier-protein] reductase FabG [Enhygromyxa salina]|uniref:3-oxoacyl-[acyl-carrier-protein] reductase FabG n=1 Tax=Enhygromyxa salina TaxID=215803 RepID=A0A2S9XXW1_9BACT|nr:SDR family oxidoreductase [Enhygromyxa salina]PRP97709.1 3-oxoacyl-[acyl-carrier-protein] reductase FabG [Enhygromyxa salina]
MRRGTALVTGSSSGFGLRTCVALCARGFKVYASMRELGRAGELRRALQASGFGSERVEFVTLDVTDADQREALVEQILDAEGAVDVLVNNAGQMLTGFAEELDEAALRAQFEVNFFGLVRLTQALLPAMRERRHGRVINVSSIVGRSAIPGHAGYCASKFALEGWSESLRYELVPFNVFVCLVEPGLFPTQIFARNRNQVESEPGSVYGRLKTGLDAGTRQLQKLLARADPDDVAQVIAKLALAERPRLRHLVGVDAWIGALASGPATQAWWEARMIQLFQR